MVSRDVTPQDCRLRELTYSAPIVRRLVTCPARRHSNPCALDLPTFRNACPALALPLRALRVPEMCALRFPCLSAHYASPKCASLSTPPPVCGCAVHARQERRRVQGHCDRPDADHAALVALRAVQQDGRPDRAHERVPDRPRRLLCRQGRRKGHPRPRAAVQEPHHRRGRPQGPGRRLRHQVRARGERRRGKQKQPLTKERG